MKRNIGDTVIIKKGLVVGDVYGACEFVREMSLLSGNEATILKVEPNGTEFKLDVDNKKYTWDTAMLSKRNLIHTVISQLKRF